MLLLYLLVAVFVFYNFLYYGLFGLHASKRCSISVPVDLENGFYSGDGLQLKAFEEGILASCVLGVFMVTDTQ